ncbi:MAG: hypothetical protein ACE5JF_00765 [Anaerolineales bacterium]
MSSQRRPLVVVLIIASFFAAGLLTVLLSGESSPQPTGTPEAEPSESVLIIGVDDLSAPAPSLVAVWQVTYSYSERDVILLGHSVDSIACKNQSGPLSELFHWDPSGGVAPEFLAAFEEMPFVIADETAFSALIDELEGLDLNGAHLQGNQVTAVLRTLYANPRGSLTTQEQFLISLGAKAASNAANVDLNRLLEFIPSHAYTSIPPQELLTTYLRLQPLDPGSILVWAPDETSATCED